MNAQYKVNPSFVYQLFMFVHKSIHGHFDHAINPSFVYQLFMFVNKSIHGHFDHAINR
jgi:hypothetical protein